MKKIFCFIVLLGIGFIGFAQTGVNFESLTYREALEKAKSEGKYVFIDCYTSWCGPCKKMTTVVFPQQKAGEYFNPKFVCVKYDMEKGEGPELGKRFGVRAYPTFLVMDANGKLLHKVIGGYGVDELIGRIEESFDEEKAYGSVRAKYEAGNRDPDFVVGYLRMLMRYYDPAMETVAVGLINSLGKKEKIQADYWFVFSHPQLIPEGSPLEAWLLKNHRRFNKTIGKEKVDKELDRRYTEKLWKQFSEDSVRLTDAQLCTLAREIAAVKLDTDAELQAYVEIARAALQKDNEKLITVCEQEFPKLKTKEAPYLQFCDRLVAGNRKSELLRYITLGEKLHAQAREEKMKDIYRFVLDFLKKKLKS